MQGLHTASVQNVTGPAQAEACLSPFRREGRGDTQTGRPCAAGCLAPCLVLWVGLAERQCERGPSLVSAVEAFEEVMDSLCVPQYSRDGEERVVLFLKMATGHTFQPELVKRIQGAIRIGLSARHVPSLILETKDIPVWPPGSRDRSAAVLPRAHTHRNSHLEAGSRFI